MKKALSILVALALCLGLTTAAFAASDAAIKAADRLYELNLFSGVGVNTDGTPNYDLDRAPNRAEAVTLLVRLLGKETEARATSWTIPFTDVADWAKPYVGYAYSNGLTSGTSATTFGGNDTVSAAQYLTFILRALGYAPGTDFEWDKAWELTDSLGITSGEYNVSSSFMRGDAVFVSANALDARLKDSNKTLLESIEESLASVPAAESNAGKTFTCVGDAWTHGDSSFSEQQNESNATVDVISAHEAVFTLECSFPITEAQNFVISFAKRTQSSQQIRDIHVFSFEYYREENRYNASGLYSLTDFENWNIVSEDEDMSGVVFTDTSAHDATVTWRVKLPDDCPFSFEMIGEYKMECTVGVFLGGA